MKHLLMWVLAIQAAGALQLRVIVYDKANLSRDMRSEAFDHLRRIFRQSKIAVEIVAGDLSAEEPSVMNYSQAPFPGREKEAACSARRDIALDIIPGALPGLAAGILGMSQPLAKAGLNVRIYYDHIQNVAAHGNVPLASLLAHAIAHEIGHVLLRSGDHSDWGLMSSVWGHREYELMERGLLSFERDKSGRMLENLRGEGCPATGFSAGGRP